MKWMDITLPMKERMPCWPGDRPYSRYLDAQIGVEGSECSVSSIETSLHCGTHVDAPAHYVQGGKTVEQLELDLLIGPCLVIELPRVQGFIAAADLEPLVPRDTLRLLVKTPNTQFIHDTKFHESYTAFTQEAIMYLLGRGIRLLGIDYFSIASFHDPGPVHRAFLSRNDTVAIEGLDLSAVPSGYYELICLPLSIKNGEGAPARVLLGTQE